jgi:WD40 repeat protein
MALSDDGSRLACAGIAEVTNPFAGIGQPLVLVFDSQSGKFLQKHGSKEKKHGSVAAVHLHPAGFVLAAVGGADGGFLYFWKPDQSDEHFLFKLPQLPLDADLHPDGTRLVTVHHDGTLRVWQLTP